MFSFFEKGFEIKVARESVSNYDANILLDVADIELSEVRFFTLLAMLTNCIEFVTNKATANIGAPHGRIHR